MGRNVVTCKWQEKEYNECKKQSRGGHHPPYAMATSQSRA